VVTSSASFELHRVGEGLAARLSVRQRVEERGQMSPLRNRRRQVRDLRVEARELAPLRGEIPRAGGGRERCEQFVDRGLHRGAAEDVVRQLRDHRRVDARERQWSIERIRFDGMHPDPG
jgi:hypothetical protein